MASRVLVHYIDGGHGDVSWSKLLTKESVEKILGGAGYSLEFHDQGVSFRKGKGKRRNARRCIVYRKEYYDFTGFKLPGTGRLTINISSDNPELLDRVLETLDRPDDIFHIDDAGYHHRGSLEIVDSSGIEPRVLAGWASIPDEDDPITPKPKPPISVHIAVVTSVESAETRQRIYSSRTEAGMWRQLREREGVPRNLKGIANDVQWLATQNRRVTWEEHDVDG